MNRIQRNSGMGAAFVIVAALAYVLGVEAANYLNDNDKEEPRRAQQMENKTADLLYRMGTIKVGDTLSNYAMEDIDGQLHLLKEIVTDRTVLAYIKPDCGACEIELDQIRKAAEKGEPTGHYIFISTSNPLHLQKMRRAYGITSLILYDEEQVLKTELRIENYPFNLVVNRNLEIIDIYAGVLGPANRSSSQRIDGRL